MPNNKAAAVKEAIRLALIYRNLSRGYNADGLSEATCRNSVLWSAEARCRVRLFESLDAILPQPGFKPGSYDDIPAYAAEDAAEKAAADLADMIAELTHLKGVKAAADKLLNLMDSGGAGVEGLDMDASEFTRAEFAELRAALEVLDA